VDAKVDKLPDQVKIVLESVLGFFGIRDVARVADGGLDYATGLTHRINAERHVLDVVERVKNTKDVHASLDGLLAKVVNHIIRI